MPVKQTAEYECDSCSSTIVHPALPAGWIALHFNALEGVAIPSPQVACSMECANALTALILHARPTIPMLVETPEKVST